MTDEEIENILSELSEFTCDNFDMSLDNLILAVLHYITRLKDEIAGLTGAVEALKTDNDNLIRTLKECDEELEERTDEADSNAALAMEQELRADKLGQELETVREETAKEILKGLSALCNGQGGVCYDSDIKAIADKFGVEVEE